MEDTQNLLNRLEELYHLIEAEIRSQEYWEEPRQLIELLDDGYYKIKSVILNGEPLEQFEFSPSPMRGVIGDRI